MRLRAPLPARDQGVLRSQPEHGIHPRSPGRVPQLATAAASKDHIWGTGRSAWRPLRRQQPSMTNYGPTAGSVSLMSVLRKELGRPHRREKYTAYSMSWHCCSRLLAGVGPVPSCLSRSPARALGYGRGGLCGTSIHGRATSLGSRLFTLMHWAPSPWGCTHENLISPRGFHQ
jgi:hypothetical protein